MIRVGNVISAFSQYVDVFIYSGGFVDGVWANTSFEKVEIFGSLQEVSGTALRMLPEGSRNAEVKTFYSKNALPIDDYQYSAGKNDIRFVVQGLTYRLVNNQYWDGDYYVYLIELLRANDAIPI